MRFFAKSALFLFITFIAASSFAQSKKTLTVNNDKTILAEFNGEKITKDEFESAFLKVGIPKLNSKADSLAEKKKFLDLYVKYKLKIKDALERGFDKDTAVVKEYESYRKSIAASMLVESEIISKGIKQIYDKKKVEFRIAQIFIKPDSTKPDLGYSKAQLVMDKIKAGEKFEDLVQQYSDDQGSKLNNGDLYYVSYGDINIPEIENSIYSTEVGKVCPQIFKTQVGFHILKVNEKKDKIFGMNVSHILTLNKVDDKEPDAESARKRINEAQDELKKGTPFADVAKKFSDDKVSKNRGGEIGSVSRGRFIKEIDELMMKMKENEVSGILPTSYGFHIIKINKILPFPTLEEEKEQLQNTYRQSGYQKDIENYIISLKDKMGYKLSESLYSKLTAVKDSFYVGDSLFYANIKAKYKDSLFVTLNNKQYVADSLFNFMVNTSDIIAKRYDKSIFDQSHNRYFSNIIITETAIKKYDNDPEFEKIMADYKKGILLFKISESEIWSKMKIDTVQIKEYWEKTKDNYVTKPQVVYREIYLTTNQLRDSVYTALKGGADFDLMLKKSIRPYSEKAKTQSPDEDELALRASKLAKEGDYTEPFDYNGGWSIVRLDKRIDKRVKTYDEAKAEVSSIVQENESKRIEEIYVNSLKDKFKLKVYMENVKI